MPETKILEVDELIGNSNKSNTTAKPKKIKKIKDPNALSGALAEISKELKLLSKEKVRLEKELETAKKRVINAQQTENMLRDKITRLTSLETKLSVEIGSKEHKLSDLKEKLNKIKKVREELSEV